MSLHLAEARAHGVGYYGFSQDEAERRAQQDALSKLRQETKREQVVAQRLRERRQQQLQARLKAARQRKRARMGLPPEEEGKVGDWLSEFMVCHD
jgi:ATPase subunit of ABC transporter with duplicated ATPase domains